MARPSQPDPPSIISTGGVAGAEGPPIALLLALHPKTPGLYLTDEVAMLSEDQITDVWERQIAAEVRSLYFGELTSQYSQKKQWITFITLFLSSGAAGSLLARSPIWVPTTLSILVAVLTAYTIAINLDLTIRSTSKLQYAWSELALDYASLWENTYADDAQQTFALLARRGRELSDLGATDTPHHPRRVEYWQDYVLRQRRLVPA